MEIEEHSQSKAESYHQSYLEYEKEEANLDHALLMSRRRFTIALSGTFVGVGIFGWGIVDSNNPQVCASSEELAYKEGIVDGAKVIAELDGKTSQEEKRKLNQAATIYENTTQHQIVCLQEKANKDKVIGAKVIGGMFLGGAGVIGMVYEFFSADIYELDANKVRGSKKYWFDSWQEEQKKAATSSQTESHSE